MERARGAAHALALGALLALVVLVILPSLDAPFTFDETAGIADNRAVRAGSSLAQALSYRFSPDQARPLFFMSLLLDARLFGPAPRAFRLTNLLLHLLCGLLLYAWLRRTLAAAAPPGGADRASWAALAGTALFLLHPLQAESVIYTWGRSGVLATIGVLAALGLLSDFGAAGGAPPASPGAVRLVRAPLAWAGAVACLGLALAAKEEAVVAPLLGLIVWRYAGRMPWRPALARAAALGAPVALFVGLRLALLGAAGRQVYVRSVADNLLGQAVVALRMLRLLLLPFGFSVDHQASVPPPALGLGALTVDLLLLAGALLLARREATRAVGAGTLFAAAATLIYWAVPLPDLMSERRVYLPLAGAALALAGAGLGIGEAAARRAAVRRVPTGRGATAPPYRLAPLSALAIAALLAPAMLARSRVWADPQRLWEEAARLAPEKARPLINLGVLAADAGDEARAADLFDRAVTLEPLNAEARFNRARLRLDAGRFKEAETDLVAAVAAAPLMTRARINLGIARIRLGDLAGAEEALRGALVVDPDEPRALTNLAEVLRATGRTSEALPLYGRALRADPAYAHAAVRLGVALEALGDRAGAIAAYRLYLARGAASDADRDAVVRKIAALEAASAPRR